MSAPFIGHPGQTSGGALGLEPVRSTGMPSRRPKPQLEPPSTQPQLKTPRDEAAEKISALVVQGKDLLSRNVNRVEEIDVLKADQSKWEKYATQLLETLFDTDRVANEFAASGSMSWPMNPSPQQRLQAVFKDIAMLVTGLESIRDRLDLFPQASSTPGARSAGADTADTRLARLLTKFHTVARRLRRRHNDRPTIQIEDEYDVQDLLNALLAIEFDDVRVEEWTPSYAGGALRMDFLLREEHIVVEVKMTRASLSVKELGEQLIVDIAKYREHPRCARLWCLIYDPGELLHNPSGLIADLEALGDERLGVHVVIAPRS